MDDDTILIIKEKIAIPYRTIVSVKTTAANEDKDEVQTFNWTRLPCEKYSLILFEQLKSVGFIANDTDINIFNNAFNGSWQKKPLAIKWIDLVKNKKYTNKHSLFYLLNELAAKNLIHEDTDNPTFLRKIKFIFYDKNGKELKNLKVSNSTSAKLPNKKNKSKSISSIDKIIDLLLKT